MNYYNIIKNDVNNGSNFRVSLFVTGCCFNCKGCWNKELQNPKCGQKFTEETKQELFNEVSKPYYEGISILGGDPLMPYNIKEITELLKEFKEKFPSKTVWLWSGYKYENVKECDVFKYVDIFVDGRFEIDKRNLSLHYRGSSNQNIIDVQESLKQNRKILAKQYYEED